MLSPATTFHLVGWPLLVVPLTLGASGSMDSGVKLHATDALGQELRNRTTLGATLPAGCSTVTASLPAGKNGSPSRILNPLPMRPALRSRTTCSPASISGHLTARARSLASGRTTHEAVKPSPFKMVFPRLLNSGSVSLPRTEPDKNRPPHRRPSRNRRLLPCGRGPFPRVQHLWDFR
jgi:hypothetical protein